MNDVGLRCRRLAESAINYLYRGRPPSGGKGGKGGKGGDLSGHISALRGVNPRLPGLLHSLRKFGIRAVHVGNQNNPIAPIARRDKPEVILCIWSKLVGTDCLGRWRGAPIRLLGCSMRTTALKWHSLVLLVRQVAVAIDQLWLQEGILTAQRIRTVEDLVGLTKVLPFAPTSP